MNPNTLEHLQRELLKLQPNLTLGDYKGDGNFSIVFAAKAGHVPCAIKFSKRPWATDPGVAKERRALLDLMLSGNGHPHVATLMDYWELDGHLVTRWELGEQSLTERLQHCQRQQGLPGIPRDELLDYLQQAAEGLDFVNGRGIVLRDVKPDNILLFQGQVKLVDFGFARLAELDSQTNSVLGTPVFTPPEAHGKRLEPSVDIYCLAGSYIRLRTGQFPFGTDAKTLLGRKQSLDFQRAGLEPHEIEVLRGALQPVSEARVYKTASALSAALAYAPPGPGPATAAAPRRVGRVAVPPPGGSFLDKIRGIVGRERQQQTELEAAQAERQAAQQSRVRHLLQQQFDAEDFALCGGTLNYLQSLQPKDPELLELRKFLDSIDPKTGLPRGASSAVGRVTYLPEGEFQMGSPPEEADRSENEFQHPVRITCPFYIGICPVTLGEFKRFVYATGHKTEAEKANEKTTWRNPGFPQQDSHPVVWVTWNDAQAYCQWASEQTGKTVRLPSESEWEYGCRGGATQYAVFGVGDGKTLTSKLANFA